MLKVLLPSFAIDQQVIKEDQEELPQFLVEQMIHAILEGGWCISQPKRHYQELIESIVTSESNLGDILLPHLYLMITRA
jgi:hypothetical protein